MTSEKPLVFIPHCRNVGVTRLAYESVRHSERARIRVLDNSGGRDWPALREFVEPEHLEQTPCWLNASQIHNYYIWRAKQEGSSVVGRMHNDAQNVGDSIDRLVDLAHFCVRTRFRFGVLLTNYDALSVWNLDCPEIYWDALRHPWYDQDNDCWNRMELGGWQRVATCLPVLHETAATTIRSDSEMRRVCMHANMLSAQLLRERWGETIAPPARAWDWSRMRLEEQAVAA